MFEALKTALAEWQTGRQEGTLAREFLGQMISSQYSHIQKPMLEIMEELKETSLERELSVGTVVSRAVDIAYHPDKMDVSPEEAELGLEYEVRVLQAYRNGEKDFYWDLEKEIQKRAKEAGLDWEKVKETSFVLSNPSGEL